MPLFNDHQGLTGSEQANQLLVTFFKSAYISSRFVENEDFKKFIHVLNPNYCLPSKDQLDQMIRESET